MDIIRNHIYRAKKPKRIMSLFVGTFFDDRAVLYVDEDRVQYDSPSVRNGRKYPFVERSKFEKWAGSDVTEGYPAGDWATYDE